MIKAIEVPEEDEEKPRVLVFMCENDAYPAPGRGGPEPRPIRPERARHPGPVPGIGEHCLDRRRALQWR